MNLRQAALLAVACAVSPHFCAALDRGGRIDGRMFFPAKTAARELSGIIVFLTPVGHEVPVRPPAEHAVISQKSAKFRPELLVIPKGQTVDFVNDDQVDHNVFSFSSARSFDLGLYPRGVFKSVKFETPGPVVTLCSIHEWMAGVIYVAPSHLFAVSDKAGGFSIVDVPPGRYVAYTWNPRFPTVSEAVEVDRVVVEAGRPVSLRIDLTKGLRGASANPGAKKP